ncbi:MAG: Hsp70 family protein, partial [Bacteroidales bacterium]|nr:Hsp70 family protein [Bacteroidales bacterium]
EVDKLNQADAMIFQTEKQLKEYGDKLPADKKSELEGILAELKTAHSNKDISGVDAAMNKMNAIWQQASQQMYQNAGQTGQPNDANADNPQADNNTQQQGGKPNDNVEDADFEEVK